MPRRVPSGLRLSNRPITAPQPAATTTPVSSSRAGVQLPRPWARANTSSMVPKAPPKAAPWNQSPPRPSSMAARAPVAAPPEMPSI